MLNKNRSTGAEAAPGHTVGNPGSQRTRKWWLRNWRLRYKMAAVLIVPTLAAIGVGGLRAYEGVSTSSELSSVVEEVELAQSAAAITHELQRERDMAMVRLVNTGTPPQAYEEQAKRVDSAVEELRAAQSRVEELDPGVAAAYRDVLNRMESLGALRSIVGTGFTESQALTSYNEVLDSLLELNERVAISAAGTNVAENAHVAEAVGEAKEQLSRMRSIVLAASMRDQFNTGEADAVRTADARFDAAYNEFDQVATPAQRSQFNAQVAGADVDATEQMKQIALIADSEDRSLGINPSDWGSKSSAYADLMRTTEEQLYSEFHDEAEALVDSARWSALRDTLIVLVVLALAFGIAFYIARSMLRPLRTLRYGALEIAQDSLPLAIKQVNDSPSTASMVSVPPVPVHTQEEIGQVARSFDAVHQQALRLASEQALLRNNVNDLFVNLARRSQTLVQRQLSLIDRLEQDEQDPDQLSSLFELDHLATRMRRNNENLLILGGTDLAQRMMRPVPLAEVIGAAVSEVEQYARINVSETPELAIQGRVVNDFVHLVAELLENATVFSNPDTEVNVRTAYRRQELVVEIRDRGVGIDADEIGEINDRLTRPPEIDVAVSRRMGLYVVGQLARRHNIRVLLQNNGDLEGGATATVHLSGEYVSQLTPDGPIPMPDVPQSADGGDRDQLGGTGNHLGLAAAFGGRGGATDRGLEPATERAPLPSLDDFGQTGPQSTASSEGFDQDESPSRDDLTVQGALSGADEVGAAGDYSVQVASGDAYGATDVPRWEDPEPETQQVEERWPDAPEVADVQGEDLPEVHDGQCGVPPGLDGPADLFNSPFEAEKTATIEAVSDYGWKDEAPEHEPDAEWASNPGPITADPQARAAADEMDDAPTQRLPIYEAVLSQWFRESSDTPSAPEPAPSAPPLTGRSSESSSTGGGDEAATGAFQDQESTGNDVSDSSASSAVAAGDSGLPRREPRGQAEPARERDSFGGTGPQAAVPAEPESQDPGWGSADVGWHAAEALAEQTKQVQETTSAGLPKRVPRSNLVPGSAAPKSTPQASPRPAPTRSADAVRGRMSNFQKGIRRGRHAKAEPVSTEPPRSNQSRHEEQE